MIAWRTVNNQVLSSEHSAIKMLCYHGCNFWIFIFLDILLYFNVLLILYSMWYKKFKGSLSLCSMPGSLCKTHQLFCWFVFNLNILQCFPWLHYSKQYRNYTIYYSHCYNKIPNRSNVRKEFLLLPAQGVCPSWRKSHSIWSIRQPVTSWLPWPGNKTINIGHSLDFSFWFSQEQHSMA